MEGTARLSSGRTIRKLAVAGGLVFAGLGLLMVARRSAHPASENNAEINGRGGAPVATLNDPVTAGPFIVADTATDSPGTNLETRVVTFMAEVGGTLPIFRQWKVDKGSGFLPVSPSATNSVLIITNARVSDTGRYSLFATNRVAFTNTTPVPLVVVEAVD